MSIIEHLEALRRMLIVIIAAWGVTTIAAFFVSGQVSSGWSQEQALGMPSTWVLAPSSLRGFKSPSISV
jgi:hypothetical protein